MKNNNQIKKIFVIALFIEILYFCYTPLKDELEIAVVIIVIILLVLIILKLIWEVLK